MSWRSAAMMLCLAGCAGIGTAPELRVPGEPLTGYEEIAFPSLVLAYRREVERSFTEAPFENGTLAVVAEEGGELSTFRFVPCAGGRAICAGGPGGPAGRLLQTPDWFVVDGLHGRRFWLSYAGDGYLEQGGRFTPLAWEARVNGTGPGDDAALETPFPH